MFYSIHQIAYYDKPAEIDYVLNITGVEKIFYIGHSMGTAAFYMLASTRPEYNAKVKACFSLGTSIYLFTTQTFRIAITILYGLRVRLHMFYSLITNIHTAIINNTFLMLIFISGS